MKELPQNWMPAAGELTGGPAGVSAGELTGRLAAELAAELAGKLAAVGPVVGWSTTDVGSKPTRLQASS
ncbi:MAG: hypothetical protein ACLFN3_03575, partial [Halochromatium sp.]